MTSGAGDKKARSGVSRLGRNLGKYCGECIDIDSVLHQIERLAADQGWVSLAFLDSPGLRLLGLHRPTLGQTSRSRVYVSAGIHGDEPAAPMAVLDMFQNNAWPRDISLWVCPCLNPSGFRQNQRENMEGVDLNRDYLAPRSREILAHTKWLQCIPDFDLSICLHEDWESQGFYLYELCEGKEVSIAPSVIEAVDRVCPIDKSEIIEGRPAIGGIIRPQIDPRSRPDWPEAFYLTTHKTPASYTLEAASDYPLELRVASLTAALRAIFDCIPGNKAKPGQIL